VNFYFDESGDFAVPDAGIDKVATCAGLVVPESSQQSLESEFEIWRQSLTPDECDRGEPKGTLLRGETRRLFFDHLDRVPDVLTVPTILDLGLQRDFVVPKLSEMSRAEGFRRVPSYPEKEMRDLFEKLARQIGNLDDSQILRMRATANCVESALRQAMLFRSSGTLAECWERITIRIDRTSARAGTREEQVMRAGVPVAIMNRSSRDPFLLIEKIHGPDHPLTRTFDTKEGLSVEKMLADLELVDSRSEVGVQAADILANSLRLAISDLNNHRGDLEWYQRFMRHSPLGYKSNLGLIIVTAGAKPSVSGHKYEILQRILMSRQDRSHEGHRR